MNQEYAGTLPGLPSAEDQPRALRACTGDLDRVTSPGPRDVIKSVTVVGYRLNSVGYFLSLSSLSLSLILLLLLL